MEKGFICYATSFSCDYTLNEATKRILETVACQHNNLSITRAYYSDGQNVILSTRTGTFVWYNSFLPSINIKMSEEDPKTQVSIFFELQRSTKQLMKLITLLVLLFETTLLVLWIMNKLVTPVLLCLPLGTMIFIYILSSVGLFISSKRVLRILFVAFAPNTQYRIRIKRGGYGTRGQGDG